MAVESKLLFHPEVLRQELRSFKMPERLMDSTPKLQHWADRIASGRADELKETDLLPDSISDIFCHRLPCNDKATTRGQQSSRSRTTAGSSQ